MYIELSIRLNVAFGPKYDSLSLVGRLVFLSFSSLTCSQVRTIHQTDKISLFRHTKKFCRQKKLVSFSWFQSLLNLAILLRIHKLTTRLPFCLSLFIPFFLPVSESVDWLNPSQSLRQQGIDEREVLLLKRRYFFSDMNVDARDPVQLNLLYVQVCLVLPLITEPAPIRSF